MKNQVIEVLHQEHGKKVIEWWESKGISTRGCFGENTREDNNKYRFYGVLNGRFSSYCWEDVLSANAEVITLPKVVKIECCDPVNNPSHYTGGSVECIDAMIAAYGKEAVANFCMCNAFKYQWRFDKKNGTEDIKKAQWYQNKFLELKG